MARQTTQDSTTPEWYGLGQVASSLSFFPIYKTKVMNYSISAPSYLFHLLDKNSV